MIQAFKNTLKKFLLRFFPPQEIHYIGSAETRPPPLSPDAEEELIDMLRQNREIESAKASLIEHNLRLVVYIAKKFENTGVGIEDLVSIGTIGLIKAINTFKPDKNIKLATYASRCIENEILMYLRKNSSTRVNISIDEPLNIDWDGNELLLSDILGTDSDITHRQMDEEVEKELLHIAMKKLSDREQRIMNLRFGINTSGGILPSISSRKRTSASAEV